MSCNRRRDRYIPRAFERSSLDSRSQAPFYAMDTQNGQIIACKNERHAKAMRTIKNKECRSWTRWIACHQDANGFQTLEN